jgi:hypothetical protein
MKWRGSYRNTMIIPSQQHKCYLLKAILGMGGGDPPLVSP